MTTTFTISLLAHQGGWDEILLVVGPIAVIMGLLAVVRRRVGNTANMGNTGNVGRGGLESETGSGTDDPGLSG